MPNIPANTPGGANYRVVGQFEKRAWGAGVTKMDQLFSRLTGELTGVPLGGSAVRLLEDQLTHRHARL